MASKRRTKSNSYKRMLNLSKSTTKGTINVKEFKNKTFQAESFRVKGGELKV